MNALQRVRLLLVSFLVVLFGAQHATAQVSLTTLGSPTQTFATLPVTSPITGGAAGALNGNLAANRTTITFSITGLNIRGAAAIVAATPHVVQQRPTICDNPRPRTASPITN